MSLFKKKYPKEENKMSWKPVAGVTVMRNQINKRWPDRDKRSDGVVGDLAHQARPSDHNPDSRGYVHAVDIDEDLRGSKNDNIWLADQIIAYARMRRSGSSRLKYVVYEEKLRQEHMPIIFGHGAVTVMVIKFICMLVLLNKGKRIQLSLEFQF